MFLRYNKNRKKWHTNSFGDFCTYISVSSGSNSALFLHIDSFSNFSTDVCLWKHMYIYVHARKCICIVIPYKPTASLNAYIFSLSDNRNLPLPKHFFHCKHWYIFVANRKRPISFHCRLRTHISVPKPLELISFRCKHHSPSLANPQNEYFFRCKGQTLLSIRCKHINPSIASPNH